MSSVCRKGRAPNLHSHLCATKGLRAPGATLLRDAIHRLASGIGAWLGMRDRGRGAGGWILKVGRSGGALYFSNLLAYRMTDTSLFTVL